jgi:cobalt-zinc-cadmium efflux system membrane fusion protein
MSSKARAVLFRFGLCTVVFGAGMAVFWWISNHWEAFFEVAAHAEHRNHAGHCGGDSGERELTVQHAANQPWANRSAQQKVSLDAQTAREFGIETATAGAGKLTILGNETLYGEIVPINGKLVHVSARVAGTVRRVGVSVGDSVRIGDVLAVVESRRLAALQSAYLVSVRRLALAKKEYARERLLRKKGINSAKEYLEARYHRDRAKSAVRENEAKLEALGFRRRHIESLSQKKLFADGRYPIRAPLSGQVVSLHAAKGEWVGPQSRAFVLADLSKVWVQVAVHGSDLNKVRIGNRITVFAPHGRHKQKTTAVVDYIAPVMDAKTRTVQARGVISNPRGMWRPGMFVRVALQKEAKSARVVVFRTSLSTLHEKDVIFVPSKDEQETYEVRHVRLGKKGAKWVEIVSGLSPGERYVSSHPFVLKGELQKSAFAAHRH